MMGVHGLTSYVEGNRQFFTDLKLRNSHLVIDGCSLYFRLYFNSSLDQARGGDYEGFALQLRRFLAALSECAVSPFVVIDGGMDQSDRKLKTLRERAQSKIREAHSLACGSRGNVLPLLVREVFRQVLHDFGVPLVQCVSEADFEVASLAQQWRCPVLANDSDFYIFDLPGGYLPFTFFEWENVSSCVSERYIPARRFTVNRFCSHFNHMNKQLLPLFAVITGNDYTPAKTSEMFFSRVELQRVVRGRGGRSNPRIEGLLLWLSQFTNPVDALEEVLDVLGGRHRGNLQKQLVVGVQDYQLPPASKLAPLFSISPPGLLDIQDLPPALTSQPEWLLRGIMSGRLPPLVMDVLVLQRALLIPQVENTRLHSSHDASLGIRKAIYGILLLNRARQDQAARAQRGRGSEGKARAGQAGRSQGSCAPSVVEEYDRLDLNLRRSSVEPCLTTTLPQLNLNTLDKVAASVRLQVVLGTLGVMEHVLQPLPPHLCLPACVTYFWLRSSTPRPSGSVLQCLLLGLMYGELRRRSGLPTDPLHSCADTASVIKQLDQIRLSTGQRRGIDLGVAHSLSQWQSCMWAGICLNQLLCCPLAEPHCVWLFSGTLLHSVAAVLRGGCQAESLLAGSPIARHLYAVLLDVVTGSTGQTQAAFSAPTANRGRGRGQGRRRKGGEGRGRSLGKNRGREGMQAAASLENKFSLLTCEEYWPED